MENYKVFDCQEMPSDIREKFFSTTEGKSNDCYVNWWVDIDPGHYGDKHVEISKWLIKDGAEDGDKVLIKHWW